MIACPISLGMFVTRKDFIERFKVWTMLSSCCIEIDLYGRIQSIRSDQG